MTLKVFPKDLSNPLRVVCVLKNPTGLITKMQDVYQRRIINSPFLNDALWLLGIVAPLIESDHTLFAACTAGLGAHRNCTILTY